MVVNLYPFEAAVSRPDCELAEALENIDIGGPALLRAAAKNHEFVGAVAAAADYAGVLKELEENDNQLSYATRFRLAQKAFAHTANYDANVSNYLGSLDHQGASKNYPDAYTMQFRLSRELRYGENPHQTAAFYTDPRPASGTMAAARQLQGKALSYNNIADADAAPGVRDRVFQTRLRHRQTRQSLWGRRGRVYRRGVSQGLRHRPIVRLRRRYRF